MVKEDIAYYHYINCIEIYVSTLGTSSLWMHAPNKTSLYLLIFIYYYLQALFERCTSSAQLDLSKFVAVRAYCCQHASQRSYVNVNFDMVCPATVFCFVPIAPVTICPSALSNRLLQLDADPEPKTGYVV